MKQDYLFSLIKSLDKSEKRNLKLYLSRYNIKKNSNVLLLFNALDKLKIFDKELFLQKEAASPFIKNFSYEKHRLQQLILHFLTDFHQEKTARIHAYSLLKQLQILGEKDQFDLALKLIEKGLTLSKDNHDNSSHHLFLREKLARAHLLDISMQEWEDLNKEFTDCLERMQNEYEYLQIYRKLVFQHYTTKLDTKEQIATNLNWLTENSFFQDESLAKSFRAKYHLYQSKNLYNLLNGNKEALIVYGEKGVRLLEENPVYLRNNLKGYLPAYFNYILVLIEAGELNLAYEAWLRLKEFPEKYKKEFAKINVMRYFYFNYYSFYIWIVIQQYEFEKGNDFIKEHQVKIEKYFNETNVHELADYFYHQIIIDFGLENYKKVVNVLFEYENTIDVNLYPIVYIPSKVMSIIAHYESGNSKIIPSLCNALHYYCKKMGFLSEDIKFQIKLLRRLQENPTAEILFEFIESQKESINNIENTTINMFELWVESKLHKISVKEMGAIKRKAIQAKSRH